jgi:UDP-N-acetylmuramyl tripeptide synthase
MENPKDIPPAIQHMKPLPLSFSEFKKQLDPSASYVVAEKSSSGDEQADLNELAELAAGFGNLTKSRHLIYDSSIHKLILIINLTSNLNGRFFQSAVSTDALQNMKVYLYGSR